MHDQLYQEPYLVISVEHSDYQLIGVGNLNNPHKIHVGISIISLRSRLFPL